MMTSNLTANWTHQFSQGLAKYFSVTHQIIEGPMDIASPCKAEGTNKFRLHDHCLLIMLCMDIPFITTSYGQRLSKPMHNRIVAQQSMHLHLKN